MLVSLSQFVGALKSESALMIFDRHAKLKYKYVSRNFLCRGNNVGTVGMNARIIEQYIKNQLEEDYMKDQLSIKEFIDSFTGKKIKNDLKFEDWLHRICFNSIGIYIAIKLLYDVT